MPFIHYSLNLSTIIMTDEDKRVENLFWVRDRLEERFGPIEKDRTRSPLDTLIQTVLSQNTTDNNRDRAEKSLWQAFDSYEEIAEASKETIAEAIKTAGLQHQKAKTIKGILTGLREMGGLELDYLDDLSAIETWENLMEFDGVGKKTAAVVSLFALDKPIFPVDTHVRRVTSRLELIKSGENHHETLTELVPDKDMYQLHLHLIRHGRETCKSRTPQCRDCVLLDRCPTGQKELDND
ncbi:endonuclease III [Candidatus Bipolaricaulota bacterium]|nr:endonuclease III [Candidatus Bipolaricaulota bacterium]